MLKTTTSTKIDISPIHILLIGNNPIELNGVVEKLNQIRTQRIRTEIAFDLKSILQRLIGFQPHFILLDDNIGRTEMLLAIQTLESNEKTKTVPITVLKSSNDNEALGASAISDYVLKQNLSAGGLYAMLQNSLTGKQTRSTLVNASQKRKEQLSKLVG